MKQLALICFLTCGYVLGQAVSQISGTATDPSGAAVPGVEIKLTQLETGVARTAISDGTGNYVVSNLPLGPYRLEASKMGFRTYVQTGIVLQVGSNSEVPVSLALGDLTQQVVVEANTSSVETRNSGVGTVIETKRILELPLNGRQPTDLITLSGLAVQTGSAPAYTMSTGVNISVAGGTSYSVQYNLDGASHLDTYVGTNMPLPFPDALQEFRLVTSTQEASGGGHSGASVNAVTKSGTNAFHGDLFEFIRNGSLNGRDFFAASDDHLKRNQFGGVLGGPIKKDKLFFFMGYQGTTTRQTPSNVTAFVPTAAMRTGDFSAYINPANGCPSAAAVRNIVDGNGKLILNLSPAAVAISARLPQTGNPCGRVSTGNPLSENRLQVPVRVDYHLSDKQTLFARYLVTRIDTKVPFDINPNDVLTSTGAGADDMAQSLALGEIFVLSPTVVNSFRISGNRVGAAQPGAHYFSPSDVGIKNLFTYTPGLTSLLVAGAGFSLGFPANFTVGTATTTNFGANDDVNMIRGSHQIAFGVNVMRALLNSNSYAWAPGVMIFAGLPFVGQAGGNPFLGTGAGITDFLTGKITQLHQANPNPEYLTQNYFGLYVQDTWKASRKLTLNYGLRWNPFFPMQFKQSDVSNFSLAGFYAGTKSKMIPSAPPGFSFPGDPGFNGRSGMDKKWGNVEPRIGIAWDPTGDGKTAIRAGAGIAYDFIRMDVHLNTSSAGPFRQTVITSAGLNLDNPFPGGDPFPYSFDPKNPAFPTTPYQGFFSIPPDVKTTQQYSWNLGIQRQITPALFASATYVGTQLIHTWSAIDLNPGQFIQGNCVAGQYGLSAAGPCTQSGNVNNRRLLELNNPSAGNILGPINQLDDGGTQRYNGVLFNTRWQMGANFSLAGNYTWSHCTGLPITTIGNLNATYPHQPFQNNGPVDRSLDMGDCTGNGASLDVRHIGNITLVANTPKFAGDWTRRLATGWTFSTIYQVRSGQPLTPTIGSDQAFNGFLAQGNYPIPQRPNQLLPTVDATNKGQSCPTAPCISYFNPAAIGLPAGGTYGNMGVGGLRGPGFWEWDQTVSRAFQVHEGQRIEIRAEAFNLTNSVRYGNPNVTLGGTFGQITSSFGGPRIMQFAVKYVF